MARLKHLRSQILRRVVLLYRAIDKILETVKVQADVALQQGFPIASVKRPKGILATFAFQRPSLSPDIELCVAFHSEMQQKALDSGF